MDTKAKIITISSGKGGVGKTCTAVNLGILLAQQGYRVCLFDADANLANVNIMLKLAPAFTLEHVLSGAKTVREITLHHSDMDIIPGASGLTDFVNLGSKQQQILLRSMQQLRSSYDYLLIDNPAGISKNVLSFINFSDENIIVITPEPTSLTDAFALIRVAQRQQPPKYFQVVVNNASNKDHALKIYKRFSMAVEKHIGCAVNFLGQVVSDERVATSVCLQTPVVLKFPNSPSAHDFKKLSIKLVTLSNHTALNRAPTVLKDSGPVQQPDFSTTAADLKHDARPRTQASVTQVLTPDKLKTELIAYINHPDTGKTKAKEILQEINRAYARRMGNYAIDLPELLNHTVKMETISEPTLRNLLMTLHSVYQDQYQPAMPTENNAATGNAIENNLSQDTVELLIKLLQQKKLAHLQQQVNLSQQLDQQNVPENVEAPENKVKPSPEHELLDSIRYAAMVDKP